MATITEIYEKVKALDTDTVAFESLDETSSEMSQAQREQLYTGRNADEGPIGEYRSPIYAEVKNRMNPLPGFGVPDLRLTGAFYQGIVTNVHGDVIITDSTDEKTANLRSKYGDDIFGLNSTFKSKFIDESLRPVFIRKIESLIGLKFSG